MFQLKTLSREAIEGALAKAERYRLLNQPWLAESICQDILETDPSHQQAIVLSILSLSEQFSGLGSAHLEECRSLVAKLQSEYERDYYSGIICERLARSHFERGTPGAGHAAYDLYTQAMEWFERADERHPRGNEDARLRWNTCARTLMKHPSIQPAPAEASHPIMLE